MKKEIVQDLVVEEFRYAADTSLQAQRDRLIIVNFYIVIFTAVLTGSQSIENLHSDTKSLLFLSLAGISILFVLYIIRLRQAWHKSVLAMSMLKELVFEKDKDIYKRFLWNIETIPRPDKGRTLSSLSVSLIGILGGVSLMLGLFYIELHQILVALFGLLYILGVQFLYYQMLKRDL